MRSRARGGKRYRNRTIRGGKFNPLKTALTAQAAIPQAQIGLQKLQQATKPENIDKINRAVNVATPALVVASSGALNPATISAAQKAVGKAAKLVQTHGSKVEEGLNKASKVDLSQMAPIAAPVAAAPAAAAPAAAAPAAAANPCAGKVGNDLLDCEAANEHGPAMTPSGGKSRRRKRRGKKSRKHRKRRTRRRGGSTCISGCY